MHNQAQKTSRQTKATFLQLTSWRADERIQWFWRFATYKEDKTLVRTLFLPLTQKQAISFQTLTSNAVSPLPVAIVVRCQGAPKPFAVSSCTTVVAFSFVDERERTAITRCGASSAFSCCKNNWKSDSRERECKTLLINHTLYQGNTAYGWQWLLSFFWWPWTPNNIIVSSTIEKKKNDLKVRWNLCRQLSLSDSIIFGFEFL